MDKRGSGFSSVVVALGSVTSSEKKEKREKTKRYRWILTMSTLRLQSQVPEILYTEILTHNAKLPQYLGSKETFPRPGTYFSGRGLALQRWRPRLVPHYFKRIKCNKTVQASKEPPKIGFLKLNTWVENQLSFCWEQNLGPLQEQPVLSIAESSLRPIQRVSYFRNFGLRELHIESCCDWRRQRAFFNPYSPQHYYLLIYMYSHSLSLQMG